MEPPYPQRKSVRHFVPGFLGCSVQPWNPPTLVIPSDPGEIFPEPRLILSEWLSISPFGGFLNLFSDMLHMFQSELDSQFSPCTSQ